MSGSLPAMEEHHSQAQRAGLALKPAARAKLSMACTIGAWRCPRESAFFAALAVASIGLMRTPPWPSADAWPNMGSI